MENKQDIGKAFKERLSGLHREPGDAVWQNISASLQQQKRGGFRMPLWGKATSIIAVVALVAVFTYPQWNRYVPQVTITMPGEEPGAGNQNPGANSQNTVTTTTSKTAGSEVATPGNTVNNPEAITNAEQTANAAQRSQGSTAGNGSANGNTKITASPVANSGANQGTGHKAGNGINTNTTAVAYHKTTAQSPKTAGSNNTTRQTVAGIPASANKSAATGTGYTTALPAAGTTASGQPNNAGNTTQTGIANTAAPAAITPNAIQNSTAAQNNSTAGAGATRSPYAKNLDSNMVYSTGNFPTITKSMADSLLLAQKKLDEEKSRERTYAQPAFAIQDLAGGDGYRNDFYVFAFIAPTNYKFGESRSLIDASLNNRGTSAETSNNYGAYIGYEFSSQFSLRTGISSVGITQRTGNVTLTGEDYSGINYANGTSNSSAATTLGNNPVTLRQKTSVIEVPLEATYAMFGTRADLYFKGGVSMFFMNENEVFAENGEGSVLLGSLKRANDFSLSGNAGIGFYYKFFRELQLNVEPGFKYYFNTFEGVNPISLYAQAGLLYRF